MTTPNQLPIDRAFVIGGSTANPSTDTSYAGNNFGQDYSDSAIRALFEIPAITLTNVVEVFTTLLLRLPLEALKIFEPIIPGGLENFTDVITAVNAIVGSLTEIVTMLPMSIFNAFLDIISGNPGAAFEEVANLLKGGLDAIHQLIDSLLGMLGLDAVGTLLDKVFDLADGFDEWFGDFDFLQGNFDDLLGIFGGSGGLAGVQNFITNLLSLFGIGDILDLTGDSGSFDPASIIEGFVTNLLNPTGLLEALLPESIMDNLQGLFGGIDLTSILDIDGVWADLISGTLNPLELIEDANVRELVQNLIDTIIEVIGGIPVVGGTLVDLLDELTGWFDDTQSTAGDASDALGGVSDIIAAIVGGFGGGSNPGGAVSGIFTAVQALLGSFGGATTTGQADNFLTNLLGLFNNPTGLTGNPGTFDPVTAGVEIISDFIPDLISGFAGFFNGWFGGSSAAGTPAEVVATAEAIRAAVAGGYTLQTFTSSNASWTVPPELAGAAEAYAVAVGGGGKGVTANSATPGAGGSSGGYTSERIDPSALAATLAITVGAGASTSGADGAQSKIMSGATTLVRSIVNEGNAASIQGYVPSSSNPGKGGVGGQASSNAALVNGTAGESSAFATGGAGGTGTTSSGGTASAGSVGGAGQTSVLPICGGAGGGGGGGKNSAFAGGGVGGNGGFPGGGSGGGGGGGGGINTAGGTPANGLVALIWK